MSTTNHTLGRHCRPKRNCPWAEAACGMGSAVESFPLACYCPVPPSAPHTHVVILSGGLKRRKWSLQCRSYSQTVSEGNHSFPSLASDPHAPSHGPARARAARRTCRALPRALSNCGPSSRLFHGRDHCDKGLARRWQPGPLKFKVAHDAACAKAFCHLHTPAGTSLPQQSHSSVCDCHVTSLLAGT